MRFFARERHWRRPTARDIVAGLVVCIGTLVVFMIAVPPASFPVGWDVWWNLHVGRTIAESGFPASLPQGGFTQFARDYADRQWLFHLVLAAFGGRELGPAHVPYLIYGFALAQVATLYACARSLVRVPVPILATLLVWGLSTTSLFRAMALRDMLLAILPLIVLVRALAEDRFEHRFRERRSWLCSFFAALVFTWSHGAPTLLLVVAFLVMLGRRLDGLRAAWSRFVPITAGIIVAIFLRPNPLGTLELLFTLNVTMPHSAWSGELPIQPAEFARPAVGALLRGAWPLFVVCLFVVGRAWRRRRWWSLALPALAFTVGSFFGARLIELAVPLNVLAVLVQLGELRWTGPRHTAVIGLGACALVASTASRLGPSLDANRFVVVEKLAADLAARARPGDVVFVTDWGLTSPLAFLTRGLPLRFTGVTDPVLMLAEAPEHFAAWWRIKAAKDPEAARTMRERFNARFAVIGFADRAPGRPVGETSTLIWESFRRLEDAGTAVISRDYPMPSPHRAIEVGYRVYELAR